MDKKDQKIKEKFDKNKCWGISTSIDLKNCDPKLIRDGEHIKDYILKLCNLIEVKRFGDPQVVDFGEDPRVSGFSLTQLIETSLISGHFVNQSNTVYLDIFSCKFYPPNIAASFSKKFFKAKSMRIKVNFRY